MLMYWMTSSQLVCKIDDFLLHFLRIKCVCGLVYWVNSWIILLTTAIYCYIIYRLRAAFSVFNSLQNKVYIYIYTSGRYHSNSSIFLGFCEWINVEIATLSVKTVKLSRVSEAMMWQHFVYYFGIFQNWNIKYIRILSLQADSQMNLLTFKQTKMLITSNVAIKYQLQYKMMSGWLETTKRNFIQKSSKYLVVHKTNGFIMNTLHKLSVKYKYEFDSIYKTWRQLYWGFFKSYWLKPTASFTPPKKKEKKTEKWLVALKLLHHWFLALWQFWLHISNKIRYNTNLYRNIYIHIG